MSRGDQHSPCTFYCLNVFSHVYACLFIAVHGSEKSSSPACGAKTHNPWKVHRAKGQHIWHAAIHMDLLCCKLIKQKGLDVHHQMSVGCQHVRVPYFSSFQNQCTYTMKLESLSHSRQYTEQYFSSYSTLTASSVCDFNGIHYGYEMVQHFVTQLMYVTLSRYSIANTDAQSSGTW